MARRRQLNLPLIVAYAATVALAGLYAGHRAGVVTVPGLDALELATIDARFKLRGPRPLAGDEIVIVALDEETRARAPEVFQKRAGWARLLGAVGRAGPAAIGVDAYFAAPEIVLPPAVVAQVRAALDVAPAGLPRDALEAVLAETRGDELLAAAVREARVVLLGALFFLDGEPAPPDVAEPPGLAGARVTEAVVSARHASRRPPEGGAQVIAPLPAVAAGAGGAGLLNVLHDEDGAVRRAYAVLGRGGRYYLPLGLALARAGRDVTFVTGEDQLGFGAASLPVDRRGRAQLDFLGPGGTFPTLSAADVISGRVPAEKLRGKLVLVGYTDAARDKLVTPFDPLFPGVELHATLAHNALHGELLRHASPAGALLTILAVGGLVALLQLRAFRARHPILLALLSLLLVAGYLVAAQLLFSRARLVIDVAGPAIIFVLVTGAALATALVVEGREKARIRAVFAQYLDDNAVKEILADPARLELGGERRELTVLFSDIRGFTQLSEDLEPEQVIAFLNEYLTPMTELVWSEGGMLDKYIGDALMAVFGAPLDHRDHAARACRAALAMQERLSALNGRWAAAGLPRIAIGVGVNTGPMSVGNMGSARRKNYTVVGDAVNLGARIEGLTKEYDAEILVGERTRALAGDTFNFRELDLVQVRGKDRRERVYELVTDDGVDAAAYAVALGCYRRREWDEAKAGFTKLLRAHPDDGPAKVMLERLEKLREAQLPDDWDGVYVQR